MLIVILMVIVIVLLFISSSLLRLSLNLLPAQLLCVPPPCEFDRPSDHQVSRPANRPVDQPGSPLVGPLDHPASQQGSLPVGQLDNPQVGHPPLHFSPPVNPSHPRLYRLWVPLTSLP
jgi:hypothetical protein